MSKAAILSLLAACLCYGQNTLSPAEKSAGWELLFDGKTMNGWQGRPTSQPNTTGDWTVTDGALVCNGTVPSWLSSAASYSDFNLKLDFRGSENVNSGVFLRSQPEGRPDATGYEVQIWDYQRGGYVTGSLVTHAKVTTPGKVQGDQWNTFDIVADGDHFVISLNGNTLLDTNNKAHASGLVGLQCGLNNKIEFRNIKIRQLKK